MLILPVFVILFAVEVPAAPHQHVGTVLGEVVVSLAGCGQTGVGENKLNWQLRSTKSTAIISSNISNQMLLSRTSESHQGSSTVNAPSKIEGITMFARPEAIATHA